MGNKQVLEEGEEGKSRGFEWIASKLRGRRGPKYDVKSTHLRNNQILFRKMIEIHILLCLSLFSLIYFKDDIGKSTSAFLVLIPIVLGFWFTISAFVGVFIQKSINIESIGIDIERKVSVLTLIYLLGLLISFSIMTWTFSSSLDYVWKVIAMVIVAMAFPIAVMSTIVQNELIYKTIKFDHKLYLGTIEIDRTGLSIQHDPAFTYKFSDDLASNETLTKCLEKGIVDKIWFMDSDDSVQTCVHLKKIDTPYTEVNEAGASLYIKEEIDTEKELRTANHWYLGFLIVVLLATCMFEPNILFMLLAFAIVTLRCLRNGDLIGEADEVNNIKSLNKLFNIADKEVDINGISLIAFIGTSLYYSVRVIGTELIEEFNKMLAYLIEWVMNLYVLIGVEPAALIYGVIILVIGVVASQKHGKALRKSLELLQHSKQDS